MIHGAIDKDKEIFQVYVRINGSTYHNCVSVLLNACTVVEMITV